ncbi:MAG: hypothetical protein CMQ21_06895 [Gammaproteobacteria bacterium]|nr:hypothetical protein [Gammaproteobacteria bacterium]
MSVRSPPDQATLDHKGLGISRPPNPPFMCNRPSSLVPPDLHLRVSESLVTLNQKDIATFHGTNESISIEIPGHGNKICSRIIVNGSAQQDL